MLVTVAPFRKEKAFHLTSIFIDVLIEKALFNDSATFNNLIVIAIVVLN